MKRAFTFLLLILAVLYTCESYNTYLSAYQLPERFRGLLSDIASQVAAITLQPAMGTKIDQARNIQTDKENLFLIHNHTLYRYNHKGEFVCRVTDPTRIEVADYLIDPAARQLIVLGNEDDVFYYTFHGELKETKKLQNDLRDRKFLSLSLYNDRIFTIEENTFFCPDTQEYLVDKEVVTYDTSFRKITSRQLAPIDMGRTQYLIGLNHSRLCVDQDTGHVFVYDPSPRPEYLLQDTLFLSYSWKENMRKALREQTIPVVPVLPAGDFMISSYPWHANKDENYTFCFDRKTRTHKQIKGGLKDDFYQTGRIDDLQPIGLGSRTFCFTQPDKKTGSVVVYIVEV